MNIGILSYWGRASGLAHVSRDVAAALLPHHRISVLKQGREPIQGPFPEVASVTLAPDYLVPKEFFLRWLDREKLGAVFFNEYNQWRKTEGYNLVSLCRDRGVKTLGYLVAERFRDADKDEYALYDAVVCPTRSMLARAEALGLTNARLVPWGVNVAEFTPGPPIRTHGPTYFHPGGHGGYRQRKNSAAVIDAFWRAHLSNVELFITNQHSGPPRRIELGPGVHLLEADLPWKDFKDMYCRADAVILPSRWETLALPVLESMAGGAPVIATDIPPMNEFITNGKDGLLVPALEFRNLPDIQVPSAEIDVDRLAQALRQMSDDPFRRLLKAEARRTAESRFDWSKNSAVLADLVGSL